MQVDDVEDYLSSNQKETLRQLLPHSEILSEEWMVNAFSVAKVFISSVVPPDL